MNKSNYLFILLIILALIALVTCVTYVTYVTLSKSNYIDLKTVNIGYRLGDFILMPKNARKRYSTTPQQIHKSFKNSIASKYFLKTDEPSDIDTLINVLQENNLLKNNDEITMHIRLGDVLCYIKGLFDEKKPPPIDKILEFIDKHSNYKINVYAFIHQGCNYKSQMYIKKLKMRKNVTVHLNGNVDRDFVNMINSKIHIGGTGNYSQLINRVREKLNKNIIYI